MRKQRFGWMGLAVMAVLASGGLVRSAEPEPEKVGNPYKALPPEVLKAWNDAGAMPFVPDRAIKMPDVFFGFYDENPVTRQKFGPGVLANLPDPGTPFGLFLDGTQVTDAILKETAKFKSLQLLRLRGLNVTDAGLKELASLENLQTLEVVGTKVTGTGLKDLAGLKHLRNLYLGMQSRTRG